MHKNLSQIGSQRGNRPGAPQRFTRVRNFHLGGRRHSTATAVGRSALRLHAPDPEQTRVLGFQHPIWSRCDPRAPLCVAQEPKQTTNKKETSTSVVRVQGDRFSCLGTAAKGKWQPATSHKTSTLLFSFSVFGSHPTPGVTPDSALRFYFWQPWGWGVGTVWDVGD